MKIPDICSNYGRFNGFCKGSSGTPKNRLRKAGTQEKMKNRKVREQTKV